MIEQTTNTDTNSQFTLFPEWADQEAVILSWPHKNSDWKHNLDQARSTYLELINAINKTNTPVILLCDKSEIDETKGLLDAKKHVAPEHKVLIVEAQYNDTWVRDYGFLTVSGNGRNIPVNFRFNGWGQKFDSRLDNQVNERLAELCQHPMQSFETVLEGGAIEIDENQHLLTTASCLFNPKRNSELSEQEYVSIFKTALGANKTTIFNYGHLQGDDTDGHIDTLARFTPLMGIVMQGSENRPKDIHFEGLSSLKQEIRKALPNHEIYSLPLPYVENKEKDRLPASYANFLILNKHVLLPIYGQAEDDTAIAITKKAFPNYQIIPVNCLSLVHQYGSLHCVSMQIPRNTLQPKIVEQALNGVSVL